MIDAAAMFSLSGRVALVTGASGALGGAFARVLADAGAAVALGGRRVDRLAALAQSLPTRSIAVALDVSEEASIERALDEVEGGLGTCDLLLNNAGIAVTRPYLEQDAASWDAVHAVNLRGAHLVARAFARRLAAVRQPGAIVNIASILGTRTMPGVASYVATKAGLLHLTRQMAVELARHQIRVNALAPGYISTDINADFFASEAGAAMTKRIPQRRLGDVEDLAGPLLLLASQAGRHMTGSVLVVDGGHSIGSL